MKVMILAGGDSGEREVSLSTGRAVFEALKRLKHDILVVDPASGQSLLDSEGRFMLEDTRTKSDNQAVADSTPRALANSLAAADYRDVDVVFVALHGGSGENGTIQNLLHLAGKKYTGSNMTASVVAMDKAISKRLMASIGVPTPDWTIAVPGHEANAARCSKEIVEKFDLPIIIKPNDGGSTIGLTKVTSPEGVSSALAKAAAYGKRVMVEDYIAGREMTVAVFDGRALPVVEIKPVSGLYDYEAKYTKGKSEYIVPAEIDGKIARDLQKAAIKVYEVIGASGLARVDFILDRHGEFFCLELNTLPGMTDLSLAPMAFKSEGVDFDGLVSLILESALKKDD